MPLQFVVFVANEKEEGLYNLNFHNCRNYDPLVTKSVIDMLLRVSSLSLSLSVFLKKKNMFCLKKKHVFILFFQE